MSIKSFMNTGQQPIGTEFRRQTAPFEISVGTGDVFSEGFGSGQEAPGSFRQDIDAVDVAVELGQPVGTLQALSAMIHDTFSDRNIERSFSQLLSGTAERRGQPLNKEEWKAGEFYREGIEYHPRMTDVAAEVLARRHDQKAKSDFIYNQASAWQGAGFFASAIAGNVVDVKNLGYSVLATPIVGLGARGLVAGGAALEMGALTSAGALLTRGTIGGLAARATADSVVAGVPIVFSGIDSSQILGEEYTTADAAIDLAAGVILSVGMLGVGRGMKATYERYMPIGDRVKLAEMQMQQIMDGNNPDVSPMVEARLADEPAIYSTADRGNAEVRKVGDVYEARYADETGLMSGVTGRGDSPDAAIATLRRVYDIETSTAARQTHLSDNYLNMAKRYSELKQRVDAFDDDTFFRQYAQERGYDFSEFENAVRIRDEAMQGKETADAALSEKPKKENRKKAAAIAERKLQEAEARISQIRGERAGLFREAQSALRQEKQRIRGEYQATRAEMTRVQTLNAKQRMQDFIQQETQFNTKNDLDPHVRDYTVGQIHADAQQADYSLQSLGNEAKMEIEALVSEGVLSDPALTRDIKKSLESVARLEEKKNIMAKFKACLKG